MADDVPAGDAAPAAAVVSGSMDFDGDDSESSSDDEDAPAPAAAPLAAVAEDSDGDDQVEVFDDAAPAAAPAIPANPLADLMGEAVAETTGAANPLADLMGEAVAETTGAAAASPEKAIVRETFTAPSATAAATAATATATDAPSGGSFGIAYQDKKKTDGYTVPSGPAFGDEAEFERELNSGEFAASTLGDEAGDADGSDDEFGGSDGRGDGDGRAALTLDDLASFRESQLAAQAEDEAAIVAELKAATTAAAGPAAAADAAGSPLRGLGAQLDVNVNNPDQAPGGAAPDADDDVPYDVHAAQRAAVSKVTGTYAEDASAAENGGAAGAEGTGITEASYTGEQVDVTGTNRPSKLQDTVIAEGDEDDEDEDEDEDGGAPPSPPKPTAAPASAATAAALRAAQAQIAATQAAPDDGFNTAVLKEAKAAPAPAPASRAPAEKKSIFGKGIGGAASSGQSKITYKQALAHFKASDLSAHRSKIVSEEFPAPSPCACIFGGGVPKLTFANAERDRDMIFLVSQVDYDPLVDTHKCIIQSIYRHLTGAKADVALSGAHWATVGFQGGDPSTDINRAFKVFALLQALRWVEKHGELARLVHTHSETSFNQATGGDMTWPLLTQSIEFTKYAVQAVRRGALHARANARGSVLDAAHDMHHACLWSFHRRMTIEPSKSPFIVLNELRKELDGSVVDVYDSWQRHINGGGGAALEGDFTDVKGAADAGGGAVAVDKKLARYAA